MVLKFDIRTMSGYNTKEHGQHPTEITMSVVGTSGAIVWRYSTGVTPSGPYGRPEILTGTNLREPSALGVSAHSEMTQENCADLNNVITDNCEYLEGRACVCTYWTGGRDKELMTAFACEGFAGVEKILTTVYKEHYNEER